jgi:hypothetical protein
VNCTRDQFLASAGLAGNKHGGIGGCIFATRASTTRKAPSLSALLLGLIPFVGMCFSVPLWDRIDPTILGLPFNLAWLLCWIVLTTLCLWAAYRVESAREKKDGGAS